MEYFYCKNVSFYNKSWKKPHHFYLNYLCLVSYPPFLPLLSLLDEEICKIMSIIKSENEIKFGM